MDMKKERAQKIGKKQKGLKTDRRKFLKGAIAAGVGAAAVPTLFNIRTAKAATTTWRIQTSWPGGIGLKIFTDWCNGIVDKTGGELAFTPFAAKAVVGAWQLFDAVEHGVLEAMNPFTLYWAGRMPAAVFFSSYPLGPRNPHEWDVFFYALGGLELARSEFAKHGMYYVGPIQHGPNIIHSKVPIRSIDDFKGRKMRVPGGMVSELFSAAGAKTTLLPGSEIFPALEKGTIDVADYVGPAVNYALGFHQVTKYISMGPPGFMSIYQPVDLMDLTVGKKPWDALSPKMRTFVEMEVHVYSDMHHAGIQKADQEAWGEFTKAGSVVTRLNEGDVARFTKLAVPLWYNWANKAKPAAQAFKIQLDYMMSGSLGYVTPDMIAGHKLKYT
jgi:TRAP-type mannitol/chloroaromatic compound transport system substrate-binding protein